MLLAIINIKFLNFLNIPKSGAHRQKQNEKVEALKKGYDKRLFDSHTTADSQEFFISKH